MPEDGPAERVGPQDAIAGGPEERAEPRAVIAADPQAEELAAELVQFSVAPKVARCA